MTPPLTPRALAPAFNHRRHLRRLTAGLALLVLALAATGPVRADLRGWFLPSTIKVLQDAPPPEAGAQVVELAAARNEVEACQLVLWSDEPLGEVTVTASALQRDIVHRGFTPTLFRVAYIPNVMGKTACPDPLPPLQGAPIALEANQATPIWISVRVPKTAAAGEYWGAIRVRAGRQNLWFRLKMQVWKFTLPDTPGCRTAFGLDVNSIAHQHGLPANSPAARALYASYYAMLLDHRISPFALPVDLLSPAATPYLNDPRLTSFVIPYPEDEAKLQKIVSRLVKGGWFHKGLFYPVDEPVKKDAYDRIDRIAERLRQSAPGAQWIVPFYRGPDWDPTRTAFDALTGKMNVWCPNLQCFDTDPRTRPFLASRRLLGEHAWWYVCCGPGAPYNNFFLDMAPLAHRLLFWQQKREQVEGLLYWNASYWNPSSTTDPWQDMATVKEINPGIFGDGSLLYPGKPVRVDGPVSSIRLEVIRDGLEDYDYLALADKALGREATLALVQRLARSLTDYESDPVEFELVRRLLGEELEKARDRLE